MNFNHDFYQSIIIAYTSIIAGDIKTKKGRCLAAFSLNLNRLKNLLDQFNTSINKSC